MAKVSFSDLEDAFLHSNHEHQYWLDKQTGAVLFVDREIAQSLEWGEDLSNAPAWQHELIEQARRVLRAFGELPGEEESDDSERERLVKIPEQESGEAYEVMEEFVETVGNRHLRELLNVALRGKGAFRRFKDVLFNYPKEREQWFEFEDRRRREMIAEWARDEGVEIDFERR